ncbi:uncharacterized protein LOC130498491 isoform X1 [Raphanus sativus]|uniref:Uncharacterized protein LOC130498491 isoform X1 n=1 Tax=Raphanus sativus TaxID=3726 RepID=A0A9W3C8Y8_RAPSA|nr:uncharacterized protein LOC130498491 isoform X1 [Raphanus sativus]
MMKMPWENFGKVLSEVVGLMYYDTDYESESELDSPKLKRQKRALYTPEEETEVIRDQVLKSEGFDIDFSNIRCEFNFSPVDLLHGNKLTKPPQIDGYLINMFCNMAVDEFNKFYVALSPNSSASEALTQNLKSENQNLKENTERWRKEIAETRHVVPYITVLITVLIFLPLNYFWILVKCKAMAVLVHRYTRDEECLESQKCLVEEERKNNFLRHKKRANKIYKMVEDRKSTSGRNKVALWLLN